ncbi:SIMPL domain-containing protein [Aliiroseovarius sp. S1339]|uniref:SIMPL domain-containing protein n=1 Tax=Aliiroseovarius sp. S1339 TaxID=2936990 RepID=UPI00200ACFF9|nr:SIMPL domain-containing protein [Aliiroseovarius sp. S1339]MCK8463661.1 SIMPL domain-containing protein [Aliiroseovarius sp. S1339]
MRKTIAILGLMMAVASPVWADGDADARLTVTGHGIAEVEPDMARISLGVIKEAVEAGDALDEVANVAQAVFARLSEVGIEARDMQSSQVNLSPKYDYNRNSDGPAKLTGFVANTMVSVRVRDLTKLGQIMSAVTADGANQLNGLQFDLQDRRPTEDAARTNAVKDAMARAKVLADAAGVALGSVVSIHEGGGRLPTPVYGRMAMEAAQSDMPIAAGELEIGSSVTMVFELEEK